MNIFLTQPRKYRTAASLPEASLKIAEKTSVPLLCLCGEDSPCYSKSYLLKLLKKDGRKWLLWMLIVSSNAKMTHQDAQWKGMFFISPGRLW